MDMANIYAACYHKFATIQKLRYISMLKVKPNYAISQFARFGFLDCMEHVPSSIWDNIGKMDSKTIMNLAIKFGQIDCVKYVLHHRLLPLCDNPLMIAIRNQQFDMVKFLLHEYPSMIGLEYYPLRYHPLCHFRNRIALHYETITYPSSAHMWKSMCIELMAAVKTGNVPIVHELYHHSNHNDSLCELMLIYAAKHGRVKLLQFIMKQPWYRPSGNHSAIFHAAKKGHLDCVKQLINADSVIGVETLRAAYQSSNNECSKFIFKNRTSWMTKTSILFVQQPKPIYRIEMYCLLLQWLLFWFHIKLYYSQH
jgi:hypothetical protein